MSIGPAEFQHAASKAAVKAFQNGSSRYLVADETGLGKTIVARSVIEKMAEGKERFIVYYFGSNLMLLEDTIQNKLAKGTGWTCHEEPKKLGMMAGEPIPSGGVHIYGFSANLLGESGSGGDNEEERPSYSALLQKQGAAIEAYIRKNGTLSETEKEVCYKLIVWCRNASTWGFGRTGMPKDPLKDKDISVLRKVLERYTLDTAPPDLIIFDEFHRYDKNLKEFIQYQKGKSGQTKILLLSATPYNYYPATEDQYTSGIAEDDGGDTEPGIKSFETLLSLLDEKLPACCKAFREGKLSSSDFAELLKNTCIYRNERLSDGREKYLTLPTAEDYQTIFAECIREESRLNTQAPPGARYWKLCSGVYSFPVQEYKKKEPHFYEGFQKAEQLFEIDDSWFLFGQDHKLKREGEYWKNLRFACIRHYNADVGRKLLWVPPSMPEYALDGPYAEHFGFTKLMIFSAYRMVPRIVSGAFSAYAADDVTVSAPVTLEDIDKKMNGLWGEELAELASLYTPECPPLLSALEAIRGIREKLKTRNKTASEPELDLTAKYILGSPYMCAVRAFGVSAQDASRISKSFNLYFKKEGVKQAVAFCGISSEESLLDYCVQGGLGAVLKEYRFAGGSLGDLVHALVYGSGIGKEVGKDVPARETPKATECSKVHVYSADCYSAENPFEVSCHYAERFHADYQDIGLAETNKTAAAHFRNCHNAFNSPFWPMILCTTAANQEGYDLDRYCSRIMHYSLPPNTMAFEQRDGRIDRRLSLLARRRMVQLYPEIRSWDVLFEQRKGESGMSPHWTQNGYLDACFANDLTPLKFERIVPYFPMTPEYILYRILMERKNRYRGHFGMPNESDAGIDAEAFEPLKLNDIDTGGQCDA